MSLKNLRVHLISDEERQANAYVNTRNIGNCDYEEDIGEEVSIERLIEGWEAVVWLFWVCIIGIFWFLTLLVGMVKEQNRA